MEIKFIENKNLKEKPKGELGFGKYFTDYMFEMDYIEGKGFINPTIKPYAPLVIDPAMMVLHYAQETFEGLKAYKNEKGETLLFRVEENAKRMQLSNRRLCMPEIPVEDFTQAVKELVAIEKDWIPTAENTALYIRPFMFATENGVGVHAAKSYKFLIICCPVGNYYKEGLAPVKIYVEDFYTRAASGGTGFAKCGGNYAASIIAQEKANKLGYAQVLWLDGKEHKYIEEVGTMNALFVINNEIYTAPIEGTVLNGITRKSCLELLKSWGYTVNEVKLSIEDLMRYGESNELTEAFGSGTAAVISPIGELNYKGKIITVNDNQIGPITNRLYQAITGIQKGLLEDEFNWTIKI